MKVLLCTLLIMTACSSKPSKSPLFDDNEIVEISGTMLEDDGTPLAAKHIELSNLRRFGYIDYTEAAIDSARKAFSALFFTIAWPFFPFYRNDPGVTDPEDYYERPNYYTDSVKTNSEGKFSFKIRAGNFLRDSDGGINITLVNEKEDPARFGKYVFVVKSKDSELGSLRLCGAEDGIDISEAASDMAFSWDKPSGTIEKYVVNFALKSDNSLLWSSEVDGDDSTPSLTLPKMIFQDFEVRVAVEAYYTFEDELKLSCLSPAQVFSVESPSESLATGALATSPNIKFRIDTLTNEGFKDGLFFDAFNTSEITLDLGEDTTINKVVFHNLKLMSDDTLTLVAIDSNGVETTVSGIKEKRFLAKTLSSPITAKTLRIEFSDDLYDLQEISLH